MCIISSPLNLVYARSLSKIACAETLKYKSSWFKNLYGEGYICDMDVFKMYHTLLAVVAFKTLLPS